MFVAWNVVDIHFLLSWSKITILQYNFYHVYKRFHMKNYHSRINYKIKETANVVKHIQQVWYMSNWELAVFPEATLSHILREKGTYRQRRGGCVLREVERERRRGWERKGKIFKQKSECEREKGKRSKERVREGEEWKGKEPLFPSFSHRRRS